MAVGILEQVKNVGVCEGAGGEQGGSGDEERDRTALLSIDASLTSRASSLLHTHSLTHIRTHGAPRHTIVYMYCLVFLSHHRAFLHFLGHTLR